MNIVSDTTFAWVLTGLTGGVSVVWLAYDASNLWRSRTADGKDPLVRDRRFGYSMGIIIALIGIVGALRYHGVV
jgi:hypothetical protein